MGLYMFTCLNLNCGKDFFLASPNVVICCPYCRAKVVRPFRQSTGTQYENYYQLFDVVSIGTEYFEKKA